MPTTYYKTRKAADDAAYDMQCSDAAHTYRPAHHNWRNVVAKYKDTTTTDDDGSCHTVEIFVEYV